MGWGVLVLEFGLPLVILGCIIAFILALLLLYLILRIFLDADTAWDVAGFILLAPVIFIVGCLCPGIILGLLTLMFFDYFLIGVILGGIIAVVYMFCKR